MKIKLLKKPRFRSKITSSKIDIQKILISALVVAVVLGTFFYLFQTRDLERTYLGGFLGSIFVDPVDEDEDGEVSEIEERSDYKEEAFSGEGLTHVARRVLSNHIEKEGITDLTAEHKIYIEDYIQKELGSGGLFLGEEVVISYDLISEAVDNSRELSQDQLNNLEQYSLLVPSL